MNSKNPDVRDLKVFGSIIDLYVFPDRNWRPEWRVEWFDEDGAGDLKIFTGPDQERRASSYFEAVRSWAEKNGKFGPGAAKDGPLPPL